MFSKEEIPDNDFLYCRVPKGMVKPATNLPAASAFTNSPKDGDNLSSDWSQYCTPISSRELIGKQKNYKGQFKDPNAFFIYQFNVGEVRAITILKQEVEHYPLFNDPEIDGMPNNQAHSIIIGDKGDENFTELRLKMVDIGNWAISPF